MAPAQGSQDICGLPAMPVQESQDFMSFACGACAGEPGFYDPMIFDTRLTSEGVAQAAAQARRVARLAPEPQVGRRPSRLLRPAA